MTLFVSHDKQNKCLYIIPFCEKKKTKDKWTVIKTKPRGVFEFTGAEMEVDENFQVCNALSRIVSHLGVGDVI